MRHPSDLIPKDEVCDAARALDSRMRTDGWGWPAYLGTYPRDEAESVKLTAIRTYDYVVTEVPAIDRRTGGLLDGWVALYAR